MASICSSQCKTGGVTEQHRAAWRRCGGLSLVGAVSFTALGIACQPCTAQSCTVQNGAATYPLGRRRPRLLPRPSVMGAKARSGNALKVGTIRGDGSRYMAIKKLNRQGRPRGDAEQRSVRVPLGLWAILERVCQQKNRNRDPLIDGKLTPSHVINVAMREWLGSNGHSTKCYLEVAEDDAA